MVKKKKKNVSFNDEEDVINPEDIDPSVGRFRNMIQTVVVIPNKVNSHFYELISYTLYAFKQFYSRSYKICKILY